jgi:hypothetical protein
MNLGLPTNPNYVQGGLVIPSIYSLMLLEAVHDGVGIPYAEAIMRFVSHRCYGEAS